MPRGSSRGFALFFLIQYRRVKERAACVCVFPHSSPVTIPFLKVIITVCKTLYIYDQCWKFECYVGTLSEVLLSLEIFYVYRNILCLQKYFIYFTFYVMLQVTLFTMAGPAIMLFYVNRFKSEIGFFMKESGIFILGHIAQPYRDLNSDRWIQSPEC